jgi:aminopeptidase N
MQSLKNAMRWDEEVYGREYDLDIFNIVAVDDFNMGAMENKSLNIFNTSCVLASPATTTDVGFQRVEGVVAHEYFHNWSGNRVTCRDWFQLSLKEGFTVFRDAEFSADMGSPVVKRVEDVGLLRTAQFAEDAGPMAHPVRPDSYMEISNFYTVTIYEKGAEVVRMIHTLLGPELFRKGSDLYFERFDGQAVTCEDFVKAMEDASGMDLGQFRLWYSQAGTPQVKASGSYDAEHSTYTLTLRQSCPKTPGQPEKEPFHIPVAVGLLGDAGALRLKLAGEEADPETADNTHKVLHLKQAEQHFVFEDVPEPWWP